MIEIKRGEQAKVVINQLFQMTALRKSSFGVTLLALDKKRPKQMNIKELIECYIEHRRDVITRRTQFRLREAEARAHILEGYIIALDNLDDFVKIIRASSNREEAKQKLMARSTSALRAPDRDAAIQRASSSMQLTGLERGKIEAEYLALETLILELRGILESEAVLMALIKKELGEMKAKYTSPRRTEIVGAASDFRMEDVVPNEGCVITVSHLGFIKRTRVSDYRSQRRGGKGVIGTETYEEDFVEDLFTASTHDYILFLTSTGQCHAKKVYDIPEGTRTSKGKSVSSFLRLAEAEKIAAMLCVKDFSDTLFVAMATRDGVIKKTALAEYESATRDGGIRGIKLNEGDKLVGCVLTTGTNEIMLISHKGQAVRFQEGPIGGSAEESSDSASPLPTAAPGAREPEAEADARPEGLRAMGRTAAGVTGMRFKYDGDFLQAIEVCDSAARLLVAREDGIGKRTPFEDYRLTRRGGTGVIAIDLPEDGSVNVAGALSVRDTDEVMLLTAKGQSIRTRVKEIRETGRGAKGVRLVTLAEGDKLLSIARIVESEEEQLAAGEETVVAPPASWRRGAVAGSHCRRGARTAEPPWAGGCGCRLQLRIHRIPFRLHCARTFPQPAASMSSGPTEAARLELSDLLGRVTLRLAPGIVIAPSRPGLVALKEPSGPRLSSSSSATTGRCCSSSVPGARSRMFCAR